MKTEEPGYEKMLTLCHASSTTCPEVHYSPSASAEKQVMITDDFGSKIYMSRDQLGAFAEAAQKGGLDF